MNTAARPARTRRLPPKGLRRKREKRKPLPTQDMDGYVQRMTPEQLVANQLDNALHLLRRAWWGWDDEVALEIDAFLSAIDPAWNEVSSRRWAEESYTDILSPVPLE